MVKFLFNLNINQNFVKQLMAIIAALGPTNTGKTHYALERLVAHKSGMIGLPLRLLTREVYDKLIKEVGPSRVAMITGEERIIPPNPQYWACTVESMPTDKPVDFLAVDEIQLMDDPERGHIFTDRLLNARGMSETLFMGSSISSKVIKKLVGDVRFQNRPRFSQLKYTGYKKISHLPKRSAIVAFSVQSVYAIAEIIKRQKGGVAIVMGSLSPQTRNAQVRMYQNGEVDYIVATDAIGMGLNLDLNHVAFAETQKFDGINYRNLHPHELAQIAGRAGRYKKDGTFGVTGEANEIEEDVVFRIEEHRFIPMVSAKWRNKKLDFSSLSNLVSSLKSLPSKIELGASRQADDLRALIRLSQDNEIKETANNPSRIKTLWETSQIPDFRNISEGEHTNMISLIFKKICEEEQLSDDWLREQIRPIEKYYGDISTLSNRLAYIRTWTFISQKSKWIKNPDYWQKKTRLIEDKLSDALHEALTDRFVDKGTNGLRLKYKDKKEILSGINSEGEITVEGKYFGRFKGLKFISEKIGSESYMKYIMSSLSKTIEEEVTKKSLKIISSELENLSLESDLSIYLKDEKIASLKPGNVPLRPEVSILYDEPLDKKIKLNLENSIKEWLNSYIELTLKEIFSLTESRDMQPGAKGIAYRLTEELGLIKRDKIEEEIKLLDKKSRQELRSIGVRIGKFSIFFPATVKPKATELLVSLWINFSGKKYSSKDIKKIKENLPRPGITSCEINNNISHQIYKVLGYLPFGKMIIRADIIERLDKLIYDEIEKDKKQHSFIITDEMIALLGCSRENIRFVIKYLGFTEYKKKSKILSNEEENKAETRYVKKYTRKPYSQKKLSKNKKDSIKNSNSNIFSENKELMSLKERL